MMLLNSILLATTFISDDTIVTILAILRTWNIVRFKSLLKPSRKVACLITAIHVTSILLLLGFGIGNMGFSEQRNKLSVHYQPIVDSRVNRSNLVTNLHGENKFVGADFANDTLTR